MDDFDKPFRDREDAGRRLAEGLRPLRLPPDTIVFGLPRGGVVVAYEVAERLGLTLEIFLVRKIGVPGHRELAMGAIASGGVAWLNQDLIQELGITEEQVNGVVEQEVAELSRRDALYRGGRPTVNIRGKTVVVVDDGLATGATMRVAVTALRAGHPARLVVAVPVAAEETCAEFQSRADEVVCLVTPEPFHAVGLWYANFSETTDADVAAYLQRAHGRAVADRREA